jgi:hypothetical protein
VAIIKGFLDIAEMLAADQMSCIEAKDIVSLNQFNQFRVVIALFTGQ